MAHDSWNIAEVAQRERRARSPQSESGEDRTTDCQNQPRESRLEGRDSKPLSPLEVLASRVWQSFVGEAAAYHCVELQPDRWYWIVLQIAAQHGLYCLVLIPPHLLHRGTEVRDGSRLSQSCLVSSV